MELENVAPVRCLLFVVYIRTLFMQVGTLIQLNGNKLSSLKDREVHFFDRYYSHGKEWYREQMPLSTMAQITMEKTPGYFIHPMAPMRIKAFDPKVKVEFYLF